MYSLYNDLQYYVLCIMYVYIIVCTKWIIGSVLLQQSLKLLNFYVIISLNFAKFKNFVIKNSEFFRKLRKQIFSRNFGRFRQLRGCEDNFTGFSRSWSRPQFRRRPKFRENVCFRNFRNYAKFRGTFEWNWPIRFAKFRWNP